MQEPQQDQGRPGSREKSALVPLALLIVPAATFLIFFVFGFTLAMSRRGAVPPPSHPAWLHFCMTHPRLLSRMFLIGLLCSGLNSLGTIAWLHRGAVQRGHYKGAFTTTSLWAEGTFLLVTLLTAAASLYKTLCGLQILSSRGVLSGLIINVIFPLGFIVLFFGLLGLVAITSLSSVIEFFTRLRRPAPGS